MKTAFILLGINCVSGASEIAKVPRAAFDLDAVLEALTHRPSHNREEVGDVR